MHHFNYRQAMDDKNCFFYWRKVDKIAWFFIYLSNYNERYRKN